MPADIGIAAVYRSKRSACGACCATGYRVEFDDPPALTLPPCYLCMGSGRTVRGWHARALDVLDGYTQPFAVAWAWRASPRAELWAVFVTAWRDTRALR